MSTLSAAQRKGNHCEDQPRTRRPHQPKGVASHSPDDHRAGAGGHRHENALKTSALRSCPRQVPVVIQRHVVGIESGGSFRLSVAGWREPTITSTGRIQADGGNYREREPAPGGATVCDSCVRHVRWDQLHLNEGDTQANHEQDNGDRSGSPEITRAERSCQARKTSVCVAFAGPPSVMFLTTTKTERAQVRMMTTRASMGRTSGTGSQMDSRRTGAVEPRGLVHLSGSHMLRRQDLRLAEPGKEDQQHRPRRGAGSTEPLTGPTPRGAIAY